MAFFELVILNACKYIWKYKALPWMSVCLITLAVYWKETLLIFDLIAKKLG